MSQLYVTKERLEFAIRSLNDIEAALRDMRNEMDIVIGRIQGCEDDEHGVCTCGDAHDELVSWRDLINAIVRPRDT